MKEGEDKAKEMCDGYLRKPISGVNLVKELTKHLSHSIKEDSKEITDLDLSKKLEQETEEAITPEIVAKLPELFQSLENDYMPKLEELKETLTINEIEEFAINIQDLCKQYQYSPIIKWGKKLETQASMFDTDAMSKTFEDFPKLIQDIKSLT